MNEINKYQKWELDTLTKMRQHAVELIERIDKASTPEEITSWGPSRHKASVKRTSLDLNMVGAAYRGGYHKANPSK